MPCTQTWRGGREHCEEPKLHRKHGRKAIGGAVRELCKVENVVSSFQTRTACNEHVLFLRTQSWRISIFIYDLADGNGRAAVRLYRERYPTRRQPNHQTFARVHQNLAGRGSFRAAIEGTGRRQNKREHPYSKKV
ncbi:hypothetical protein TNCV_1091481 [Trichonephila clavipes]|nr:hypothetical protein TNCV_1091481 [Trichonephila clavipes]